MRRIGGVRGGEGERGVRRESEGRGCERIRGVERRGGAGVWGGAIEEAEDYYYGGSGDR